MPRVLLLCLVAISATNGFYYDYDHDDSSSHDHDGRHWRFAIDTLPTSFGGYLYKGPDGITTGFYIDLIQGVCKRAGRTCHWTLDEFTNCWRTDPHGMEYPGQGLMAGWYDGCLGFLSTPERINSFDFTEAFSAPWHAALYYKKGNVPSDPHDLKGKKIGFVSGLASSRQCLARHGEYAHNDEKSYTFVVRETYQDLIDLLKADPPQIDAIFITGMKNPDQQGLVESTVTVSCASQGLGIMTPYGSGLPQWWNKAFNQMMRDGSFKQLCEDTNKKHHEVGPVACRV